MDVSIYAEEISIIMSLLFQQQQILTVIIHTRGSRNCKVKKSYLHEASRHPQLIEQLQDSGNDTINTNPTTVTTLGTKD